MSEEPNRDRGSLQGPVEESEAMGQPEDFSPKSLAVLSARGILTATARRAGIHSYWTPSEGARLLGLREGEVAPSAPGLVIPFLGTPGYAKVRPDDPWVVDPDYVPPSTIQAEYMREALPEYVEGAKYVCPRGRGAPIYFPFGPDDELLKSSDEIWICESEFKALALRQMNIAAIGIQGVQGGGDSALRWVTKAEGNEVRRVSPAIELLAATGKKFVICFDSDVDTNQRVLSALHRLGMMLVARKSEVSIAYVPPGKTSASVGVDDLLAVGGSDAERRLADLQDSVRPFNVAKVVDDWLETRWDDLSSAERDLELRRAAKLARLFFRQEYDFKNWMRAAKKALHKITFEHIEALAPVPDKTSHDVSRTFATLCEMLRDDDARAIACGRSGKLEMDERTRELFIGRAPYGSDTDVSSCRELIATKLKPEGFEGNFDFNKEMIVDALTLIGNESKFNPVREYLRGLTWDGAPRLERILGNVLKVSPAGARSIEPVLIRKWFVGAVARALRPGCKMDNVLILVGAQGVKKSSFFEVLAGNWFSDSPVAIGDKDGMMLLGKLWIVEWPELHSMLRAKDDNAVKAFVSSRQDTFRPPYGRALVTGQRSSVFVGTTNDEEFLTDPTGNRRYWTLQVHGETNLDLLLTWRDQLWAEAVAAFDAGEQWWLTSTENDQLTEIQVEHQRVDPWLEIIEAWLRGRGRIQVSAVLENALSKKKADINRADQMRVVAVLKSLGWILDPKRVGRNKLKFYVSPSYDPLTPEPPLDPIPIPVHLLPRTPGPTAKH